MREIVRVNMGTGAITREPVPDKWALYGGRALTSAIVYTEVPADSDPLGAENKLVFAPGLLGGTAAPDGGRLSVGAKSPLTGGIKEANSGGQAAHALGRLGIAAIIVEGKPTDPDARYMLVLEADGSIKLERVDEWAGMENYPLADAVKATRPEGDRYATIQNGPAGEMLMKSAGIAVTDTKGYPNRFAGRGGLGAVMGSKGLKAIVVSDKGLTSRQPEDKEAFTGAVRRFATALTSHAVSGQALPTYGTQVLANIINEAGGYPTRNFSSGQFEGVEGISGETMREITLERNGNVKHACHSGCVIQCSRYYNDADGNYLTKGPEYESAWALGADCGIDSMDAVAYLDRKCGELGIDTIEAGVMLGVYMDSGEIAFGDADAAMKALEEIGKGTELGRVLGDGAEATGLHFGVKNIPVVKHQGLPAYDPRPIQGIGVTYATSPMGADHTAGYTITANVLAVGGTVDPLGTEGQSDLSAGLQIATAMLDSLGFCIFVAFPVLDIPEAFTAIHEMAEAFTGKKWDADALMELGKEALTYERVFNANAGFTAADDRLPAFFYEEKLAPHDVVFTVSDKDLDAVWSFVPETAAKLGIS